MAFSAPFNGDLDLLRGLPKVDENDPSAVRRVYGREDGGIVGGGRSRQFRPVGPEDMTEAIDICHARGIKFDYVLNAPFLFGKENSPEGREELRRTLERIREIRADMVIVAVPHLLLTSKAQAPHFPVGVSRFVPTDGYQRMRKLVEMGADRVCLDLRATRDFALLRQLQEGFAGKVQLLLNDACAHDCPRQMEHPLRSAHVSLGSEQTKYCPDCTLWCIRQALRNPAEILMSAFIRPEDLHQYTALGLDDFKLTDRNKPTEWIRNVITAYQRGRYDGNLADLLGLLSTYRAEIMPIQDVRAEAEREVRSDDDARRINRSVASMVDLHIDNRKLDGFGDIFRAGQCQRTCPDHCRHCYDAAESAIHIEEERKLLVGRILDKVYRYVYPGTDT